MDQEGQESLAVGQEVGILFNPTELFLARDLQGEISIRNRFEGEIVAVEKGDVLSKITLKCGTAQLISIITTASAERLGCDIGQPMTALLKTNELLFDLNPNHE